MLARQTAPVAAVRPTGPVRGFGIPEIALRRRSQEHPMAMFAIIVTAAFTSMVAMSIEGRAVAAGAPLKIAEAIDDTSRTTDKTDRLPASETQRACRGQAWGSQSLDCVVMIARESGKAEGAIRLVSADIPNRDAPNVF